MRLAHVAKICEGHPDAPSERQDSTVVATDAIRHGVRREVGVTLRCPRDEELGGRGGYSDVMIDAKSQDYLERG